MKIAITAFGTRGDVQPLVALGKGLKDDGHEIVMVTHELFESFVLEAGLTFRVLRGLDLKELIESLTGQAAHHGGKESQFMQTIHALRSVTSAIPTLGDSCWDACQGAELMMFNVVLPGIADSVAEKLGVPQVAVALQPFDMTAEFPLAWVSTRSLGGALNRFTYLAFISFWAVLRPSVNTWRRQRLSLPALGWNLLKMAAESPIPRLYGFSSHVIPKPRDWGEQMKVTGYWFLDQTDHWQPPPALVDFLESGPPPVYIGFGSVVVNNPEESAEIVLQALERTKHRGILLTGWGGLQQSDLPDSVMKVESAPHEWLFPRMAAVVHHGGAGTTAAGLRAGIPSILIPFTMDQPFWGKRVYDLGVGPKPIPRRKLTADRLAAAIHAAITDTAMQQRAAALGERIRTEDGITNAVEHIRRMLH